MADDNFDLRCGDLRAVVARHGAELVALEHRGRPILWHGDPAIWGRRAPLLFPVVGRSPAGRVTIDGVEFTMPAHGFARDRNFDAVDRRDRAVRLVLEADDVTLAMFPFTFRLSVEVAVEEAALSIVALVENADRRPMPFGFGYHPGFLWPVDAAERSRHVLRFDKAEDPTVRRADPDTGLLLPVHEALPLAGRTLPLGDSLFERGSIQFERARSRGVWFGPKAGAGIRVGFPDSPQLGIWTVPSAPFLCIEPWQGLAAETGGSPELVRRPGMRVLEPGASARYRLRIVPGVADPGP